MCRDNHEGRELTGLSTCTCTKRAGNNWDLRIGTFHAPVKSIKTWIRCPFQGHRPKLSINLHGALIFVKNTKIGVVRNLYSVQWDQWGMCGRSLTTHKTPPERAYSENVEIKTILKYICTVGWRFREIANFNGERVFIWWLKYDMFHVYMHQRRHVNDALKCDLLHHSYTKFIARCIVKKPTVIFHT